MGETPLENSTPSEVCAASHNVDLYNAQAEADIRKKALSLSATCIYMLLVSHIAFAYMGKTLPIPEIIWAIVLGPWFGAAGGKIASVLDDVLSRGKR